MMLPSLTKRDDCLQVHLQNTCVRVYDPSKCGKKMSGEKNVHRMNVKNKATVMVLLQMYIS